jgi:hypothetical protein
MVMTVVLMNDKASVLPGFLCIRRRHLASARRGFQASAADVFDTAGVGVKLLHRCFRKEGIQCSLTLPSGQIKKPALMRRFSL